MNAVSTLNLLAKQVVNFAWPMFWQSSLLIAFILALDLLLCKKVRPAVRCGLWLMVFAKLLLPPSFALPSGICWWLRHPAPKPGMYREARTVVTYVADKTDGLDRTPPPAPVPSPGPVLTFSASCVLVWIGVSVGLLGWMVIRWRQVARQALLASPPPDWLDKVLEQARLCAQVRRQVGLKVGDGYESPAVYGLLRPIILIPQPLLQQLTSAQLRAVLLHELIHVRRADAWVSCAQSLLQIVYWWQPLLWLANARIRRVREEAVDDSVMMALGADTNSYVPTLVEVAKLALNRPLLNLALVGIFESQSSLRQRIDRLIDFRPPRKPGLTLVSVICILSLAALALPMGEAPPISATPHSVANPGKIPWPDPRFEGYADVKLESQFMVADEGALRPVLPSLIDQQEPLLFSSNQVVELNLRLKQAQVRSFNSAEPLKFAKFSGGTFHWSIGSVTNNWVNYLTRSAGEQTVVTGADTGFIPNQPDWVPLQLTVVPWAADTGVRCQMRLAVADNPYSTQATDVTIPTGGAAVWAILAEPNARKYELVLLREQSGATNEAESSTPNTNPAVGEVLAERASTDRGLDPRSRDVKGAKAPEQGAPPVVGGNTWRVESLSGESSSLEYDAAAGKIRATDGALVRCGQTMLRADQVTGVVSNHQLVELIAQGNVRLERAQQTWTGDRLRIRFPDSTNGVATILNDSPPARKATAESSNTPAEDTTTRYDIGANPLDNGTNDLGSLFPSAGFDDTVFTFSGRTFHSLSQVFPPPLDHPETDATQPLDTRIIKIGKDSLETTVGGETKASMEQRLREFLARRGVELKPPETLFFNEDERTFLIRATRSNLEAIEQALPKFRVRELSAESSSAPDQTQQPGSSSAIPSEAANANTARNRTYYYLDQTRLQTVWFNNTPLREAVEDLTRWAGKTNLGQNAIAFTCQREPEDVGEVRITIQPALTDVRLADVIDEICKVSPRPLKYSVNETGIVFAPKSSEPVLLYTRVIKVDPRSFVRNLSAAIGAKSDATIGQVQFRDFFSLYGVNLEPPKAIFFNEAEGSLRVRATLAELDKVERAILDLNGGLAQLNIKANFVILPEAVAETFCSSLGLTNAVSGDLNTVSTMLTVPQSAVLLKTLESADGVDALSAMSVTTLSGRQAQIQVVDLITAVTNLNLQALTAPGISPPPPVTKSLQRTATVPFGPTLDVVGWVSPDARSIELVVNVTYVGYENAPGPGLRPSPHIRFGKATGTVFVKEGQTLLLETMLSDASATAAAAVPELQKKRLLVFVTPRVLSPNQNSKSGEFLSPEPPLR